MKQTPNYGLTMMEARDPISMTPLNNALKKIDKIFNESPKFAVGSYNGTGKSGINNPLTLTFDFEPQAVWIFPYDRGYNTLRDYTVFFREMSWGIASEKQPNAAGYQAILTWLDNGVSWYSANTSSYVVNCQCNNSNFTYFYLAIG